ncbi:uncharacterized protein [Physcomitrium patens]|uniref:Uncharacterized protein n=1 Tax=Physcomitrium patens TaxID=3218 RepID=A0A7I4BBG7_PHYPA
MADQYCQVINVGVDDIETCLEIAAADSEWSWVTLPPITSPVHSGIYGNHDKATNCPVIVIKTKCITEPSLKTHNWFIFNDHEVFKDYLEWGVDKFEYGTLCKRMM